MLKLSFVLLAFMVGCSHSYTDNCNDKYNESYKNNYKCTNLGQVLLCEDQEYLNRFYKENDVYVQSIVKEIEQKKIEQYVGYSQSKDSRLINMWDSVRDDVLMKDYPNRLRPVSVTKIDSLFPTIWEYYLEKDGTHRFRLNTSVFRSSLYKDVDGLITASKKFGNVFISADLHKSFLILKMLSKYIETFNFRKSSVYTASGKSFKDAFVDNLCNVYLNKDSLNNYTESQLKAILAHEASHCAMNSYNAINLCFFDMFYDIMSQLGYEGISEIAGDQLSSLLDSMFNFLSFEYIADSSTVLYLHNKEASEEYAGIILKKVPADNYQLWRIIVVESVARILEKVSSVDEFFKLLRLYFLSHPKVVVENESLIESAQTLYLKIYSMYICTNLSMGISLSKMKKFPYGMHVAVIKETKCEMPKSLEDYFDTLYVAISKYNLGWVRNNFPL
ncbi:MAG: M48 family metalloprotease [Desulfovibrio sp.]|uniref:M48 family metalloprotease n=1 Tax=Desulfovibrio sp. 7SRBS1 TaxID=3378064 RepID=UPI003B41B3BE